MSFLAPPAVWWPVCSLTERPVGGSFFAWPSDFLFFERRRRRAHIRAASRKLSGTLPARSFGVRSLSSLTARRLYSTHATAG